MAILQKIRNQSVLLLVVVGVAMLAFIIGDFLNSGATYFNQSRENIGKINGEAIHITEYTAAVDQMTEVYKIETGQTSLDDELSTQIRTSVWESLVNEKLLQAEADRIGLTVTAEELYDRTLGNNIHPIIMQRRAFYDENGQFNRNLLLNFLNSMDMEPENEVMAEQLDQLKKYWLFWENAVRTSILQEKYTALFTQTLTANTLDAKMNYEGRSKTINASYIMQPYYSLPDSTISISDSEIKALYNKRKEQYKQEPNCNILYITYPIKPSTEDFAEVEQWMNNLKPEFETTDDITGIVNSNSDKLYEDLYYSAATVPTHLKEFAFSGKVNDVTPILFENDTYYMARIIENNVMQPDSVRLRHIYLADNNKVRTDSIINALNKKADFAELAAQYSIVPQTAQNGGEIGWVIQTGLPKEIAIPAFSKANNEIFTVDNGQSTQIFQIMEKSPLTPKVKLAIIERNVTPSSRTQSALYNEAKQFIVNNDSRDTFEAAAKEQGLSLQSGYGLQKNTEQVGQLKQSRQIIRWAFDSKENAVSDVFECGDYFVVAIVTKVNKEEYRTIADVAPELRIELLKDKKAALITDKLTGRTLEEAAQLAKSDIQQAENTSLAAYRFGSAGMEPYIIGATTILTNNETSAPLQGNNGVFVVKATTVTPVESNYDEASEIIQMNMRMSYSLPYMTLQLLRDEAKIEDNRATFY